MEAAGSVDGASVVGGSRLGAAVEEKSRIVTNSWESSPPLRATYATIVPIALGLVNVKG
jgi:hypothetical protein